MTETALPITVKAVLSLNPDFFKLFQGGVSVFLAGTTGVGKSSFRLALKRSSLEVLQNVARTTGNDSELIHYQADTSKPNTFPLMCYDLGGEEMFRDYRNGVLLKEYPLGMVVFLDHRNHKKQVVEALGEKRTRESIIAYANEHKEELCRIDNNRVEEHRKYIKDITSLLKINPALTKYCRVIVPVVNKFDMWKTHHNVEDFQELFKEQFLELAELGSHVASFIPCSTYENYGVSSAMNTFLSHAGREWRLLGLRWRANKSFVG